MKNLWLFSHWVIPSSLWPHGLYYTVHGIARPEYWSGSLSLLQGIFPTQESNPGLLHYRQIVYQLSHKRSPFRYHRYPLFGLPKWLSSKEFSCQAIDMDSIPGKGKWQPTPVSLRGKSHGQRSLVGYSPQGHKELDTTEHACTLFILKSCNKNIRIKIMWEREVVMRLNFNRAIME